MGALEMFKIDEACVRHASALADAMKFDEDAIRGALQAFSVEQSREECRRTCRILTFKLAAAMASVDRLKEFLIDHQLVAVSAEEIEQERARRRLSIKDDAGAGGVA